jgi:DNA polymerase IV
MEHHVSPQPLRYLFLDLNSFFASVEQQERPHLRGKPVIVVPVKSDGTCAIAASIEAKKHGIKTGTAVHVARTLCPEVAAVVASHQRYLTYHERIVAEVWQHIPVSKICSIDEMACALIGTERDAAQAADIARRIKRGILDNVGTCLTCSVGIAPSRLLAKIGSNLQKPDGLIVMEHADIPGRLFPLALTDLPGIASNRARRLAEAGITTIEQFWNLSPGRARRAWGSVDGERFWYGLHGIDIPDIPTKRGSVGHSHVLAPALRPAAEARMVTRRLLAKAATRMRRMGYHARKLGLSTSLADRNHAMRRWSADIALPSGCDDTMTLLAALDVLWNRRSNAQGSAAIKKVGVMLHGLVANAEVIPDLFGPDPDCFSGRERQHSKPQLQSLSQAMDALNQRFGRDTVAFGKSNIVLPRDTGTKIAFTRVPEQVEFLE